jgi:chitinase
MQRLDTNGMPPLAHRSIDPAGVALVQAWIESLPGRASIEPPRFAPDSGDFAGPVTVTIMAAAGAAIRYTLDGSAPRADSSLYEHPLTLARSVTLRARAFSPGVRASIAATATYVVEAMPDHTTDLRP